MRSAVFTFGKTISFRTPINAFAHAFIISGRQIRTPMALCRIRRVKKSGDRRILALTCATFVAVERDPLPSWRPCRMAPFTDTSTTQTRREADMSGVRFEPAVWAWESRNVAAWRDSSSMRHNKGTSRRAPFCSFSPFV